MGSGAEVKAMLRELCGCDWIGCGFGWPEQFLQPCWQVTGACVQVKAAEEESVCLSGDAADVVPIAEARMRWRGLSSKYYGGVAGDERMDGLLEGRLGR